MGYRSQQYQRGTEKIRHLTIQTLDKVCKGLGISLSQFFAEGSDAVSLTPEQKDMLDNWSALNIQQKQIIRDLLKKYALSVITLKRYGKAN